MKDKLKVKILMILSLSLSLQWALSLEPDDIDHLQTKTMIKITRNVS